LGKGTKNILNRKEKGLNDMDTSPKWERETFKFRLDWKRKTPQTGEK